jgi:hypothetical protein
MKKLYSTILLSLAFLVTFAQYQDPPPYVEYGDDVFIVEIETVDGQSIEFLQVGKSFKAPNPTSINDFPTEIHQYVSSFRVLFNGTVRVNGLQFKLTNGDGLIDNFGNFYLPFNNNNSGDNNTDCVDQAWQSIGEQFNFPKDDIYCDNWNHILSLVYEQKLALVKAIIYAKNINPNDCISNYLPELDEFYVGINSNPGMELDVTNLWLEAFYNNNIPGEDTSDCN